MIELTLYWNGLLDKYFIIKIKESASFGFLRFKIGENFEKYGIFNGLTSLRAANLSMNKKELPRVSFM
jgi:hypothetical protein